MNVCLGHWHMIFATSFGSQNQPFTADIDAVFWFQIKEVETLKRHVSCSKPFYLQLKGPSVSNHFVFVKFSWVLPARSKGYISLDYSLCDNYVDKRTLHLSSGSVTNVQEHLILGKEDTECCIVMEIAVSDMTKSWGDEKSHRTPLHNVALFHSFRQIHSRIGHLPEYHCVNLFTSGYLQTRHWDRGNKA